VIVKGDEAVRLGRTVQVMDIARQLGAEQLAIAAEPLGESRRR
jgi:biopolymer transport protein ExbD